MCHVLCLDFDCGLDQGESERVHLSRAVGRPAVRPVVSHLLGGAGHRVVPHNGDIDQGVGAKPLQPGPERAAAGQTQ